MQQNSVLNSHQSYNTVTTKTLNTNFENKKYPLYFNKVILKKIKYKTVKVKTHIFKF